MGPGCGLLNAEGIRVKEEAVFAVAEGIQDEAELIVVIDLFAPDHVSTNFVRLRIKTNTDDVEILIGVAEVDFGFLRDGRPILGIALHEAFDLEHLAGERSRRLHRKKVGDGWAVLQARDVETGECARIFARRTCQSRERRPQNDAKNQPHDQRMLAGRRMAHYKPPKRIPRYRKGLGDGRKAHPGFESAESTYHISSARAPFAIRHIPDF